MKKDVTTQPQETVVEEVNNEQIAVETVSTEDTATAKRSGISKHFSAGNMAVMGILTALSFILYMFVKFPLPFMFPSFLDMQISDLPALLGGFALGPVEGSLIIIIKCCIKMPFSSTGCIGELGDIAIGIANVLPAALIYRFYKNRKGAILGMLAGMICAVAVGLLMNWLVLIPFYADKFGMAAVVGMMQSLYPNVTEASVYNYYLPLAVLPFNVLRCLVCALVTYFTYKPLSKALHWEIKFKKKSAEQQMEEATAATEAEQVADEQTEQLTTSDESAEE